MSLEVYGDGDAEDLCELANRYDHSLYPDGKWREDDSEPGKTDAEMWEYVEDRRQSDLEDMALSGEDMA